MKITFLVPGLYRDLINPSVAPSPRLIRHAVVGTWLGLAVDPRDGTPGLQVLMDPQAYRGRRLRAPVMQVTPFALALGDAGQVLHNPRHALDAMREYERELMLLMPDWPYEDLFSPAHRLAAVTIKRASEWDGQEDLQSLFRPVPREEVERAREEVGRAKLPKPPVREAPRLIDPKPRPRRDKFVFIETGGPGEAQELRGRLDSWRRGGL